MVRYIGIDIGGTSIRVGAMDENENITFTYKEPTFKDVKTAKDLYEKIKGLVKKVPNYEEAVAIGIGFPGSIDESKEKILASHHVGILAGFPLVEKLKDEFKKPVYMENDARLAGLAEAVFGRGKDKNIVCYITVSTGLGGGIIINKKIYSGSSNLGGYFSKVILDGKNTTEELISGTSLINRVKEKVDRNINSMQEILALRENGNIVVNEIVEEFKENLVLFLLNITTFINPDIIVFGGGIIKAKEEFLQEIVDSFRKKAHPLAKNTIIDTAILEEPGIIGAAMLAKTKKVDLINKF